MKARGIRSFTALLCALLIIGLLSACAGNNNGNEEGAKSGNTSSGGAAEENTSTDKEVTLTVISGNLQDTVTQTNAYIEAFTKKYPYIKIELETLPGGTEGDNITKTRLATGDMADVFFYNSGSLMLALNPEKNLLDLTNEPFQENVMDSFKATVSQNGKVYGAPFSSTGVGGWFYNKKIYADLGLKVPTTWEALMENNEKIKAAGITPVIGSFKDTWTAQMIFLSDYFNVQAQVPTFGEDFTAHKATIAGTPAILRSFEKMQEIHDKGYWNKDVLATTYDAALKMLAEGKGAHYPMLSLATTALSQNFPDEIDNIGFFAQPGDDASKNGITVWMPSAAYIYKESKHIEEAKLLVSFIASVEGTEAIGSVSDPNGPYLIKGATIPDSVPQLVKDMLPYFDSGNNAPALEFSSPIKGPNLEQIAVEVGSGIKDAKKGAESYDKDVEKQAKQLGLEGW